MIEYDSFIDAEGNYSLELQEAYLEDLAQEYDNMNDYDYE